MTQLHLGDPENRQQNRFSEQWFSKKKPVTTSWMEKCGLSADNAQFVTVNLIREKNQVILDHLINYIYEIIIWYFHQGSVPGL